MLNCLNFVNVVGMTKTNSPAARTSTSAKILLVLAAGLALFLLLAGCASESTQTQSQSSTTATVSTQAVPVQVQRDVFALAMVGDYAPTMDNDLLTSEQWDAALAIYRASEVNPEAGCSTIASQVMADGVFVSADSLSWSCLGGPNSATTAELIKLSPAAQS